ncbi:MAG TPA: hypothetical protein VF631_09445 [Allosphingosinicella sp.]|jgi:hypothetical protein
MRIEIGWALGRAEDFLRRQIKTKAVREAEARQRERQAQENKVRFQERAREAGRRLGRAAAVTGLSGASVIGYGIAVAPVGGPSLVAAGAATLAAATAALVWPSRRAPAGESVARAELAALPFRAEDYLLRHRDLLPSVACAALDAIHDALGELDRHLGELHPDAPLAGEAHRLLQAHLPGLIDSFLALPKSARTPDVCGRLAQSLGVLADELARLTTEIGRDRMTSFETQERFVQSRYRERGW